MVPPPTVVTDNKLQLTTTTISGHLSYVGRAQNRESSPVKDRCSTALPTSQNKYRAALETADF